MNIKNNQSAKTKSVNKGGGFTLYTLFCSVLADSPSRRSSCYILQPGDIHSVVLIRLPEASLQQTSILSFYKSSHLCQWDQFHVRLILLPRIWSLFGFHIGLLKVESIISFYNVRGLINKTKLSSKMPSSVL